MIIRSELYFDGLIDGIIKNLENNINLIEKDYSLSIVSKILCADFLYEFPAILFNKNTINTDIVNYIDSYFERENIDVDFSRAKIKVTNDLIEMLKKLKRN